MGLTSLDDLAAQGSIGFFYSEARNFFTTNQYVVSQSVQLITSATQTASTSLISSFLSGGVDANALATLGETEAGRMVLTRPFGYSEYNLRPFDQLAGEAATTAGAIYLIVRVVGSLGTREGTCFAHLPLARPPDLRLLLHSHVDGGLFDRTDEIDARV